MRGPLSGFFFACEGEGEGEEEGEGRERERERERGGECLLCLLDCKVRYVT